MKKLTIKALLIIGLSHLKERKSNEKAKTVPNVLVTEDGQLFDTESLKNATGYANGKCKIFLVETGAESLKLFAGYSTEEVKVTDKQEKLYRKVKTVHTPVFEDFKEGDSAEAMAIAAQEKAQKKADAALAASTAATKELKIAEAKSARAAEEEASQKKHDADEKEEAELKAAKEKEEEEAAQVEADKKAKVEEEAAAKKKEEEEASAKLKEQKEAADKAQAEADAKVKEEAADKLKSELLEFNESEAKEDDLIEAILKHGLSEKKASTLKKNSMEELKKIIADAKAAA